MNPAGVKRTEKTMRRISRREACVTLGAFLGALAVPLTCPGALLAQEAFELNIKGQDLLARGKIEEAVKILRKAVAEDARNERSWSLLARAYAASGDPGGALACYQRALILNPRDSLTRMMVDILSQNPQPKPRDPKLALKRREEGGRMTALEKAADEERRAVMAGKEVGGSGAPRPWRLVIDPGHGGDDFGCDANNGLYEKQIALDIGLRAARALYALCPEAEIYLTRMGDYAVPGYVRALFATLYGADLFVSIHASCSQDEKRNGMAVYSYGPKPSNEVAGETAVLENQAIARSGGAQAPGRTEDMAQSLLRRRDEKLFRDNGAKAASALAGALSARKAYSSLRLGEGPFALLAAVPAPAVLIETGMVSSVYDAGLLADVEKREALAQALAQGLRDAFGCGAGGEGGKRGQ